MRSFRLDRANRPHIRPPRPINSLDEKRERNGVAIEEGQPPNLRRRDTENGDRQDRNEAGKQGRRRLRREPPGDPEGLHDENGETDGADKAKLRENRLRLLNEIREATRAGADFSRIEG